LILADEGLGIRGLAQNLQLWTLFQNLLDFRTLAPGPIENGYG
jgi:hypothetical protein